MASRLAEVGLALSSIIEAVKAMKSIRGKNQKLNIVTEEVKRQAHELKNIELPDDERLKKSQLSLCELKETLQSTETSIRKLEQWLKIFFFETSQFESFVRGKLDSRKFSPTETREMCRQLIKAHKISGNFASAFEDFFRKLSNAMAAAADLTSSLKEQSEELEKSASSQAGWGSAGAAGLLAGGLAVLGFFTGGAAWAVAGALGAASAAAGAKTAVDLKATQKLASDIISGANQLEGIAERMKKSCNLAGEIQLDLDALKTLELALYYFGKQKEKDEELVRQKNVLEEQDGRIAKLEAEIGRRSRKGGAN